MRTRIVASTIGILIGVANINHGIFETLQGNNQTPGFIIQAIGEANRIWIHGTEEAFTIVPNYLYTGLLAILIGSCIIAWSIGFIHKRHGRTVFIALCILSVLFGGGIGQIIFFFTSWLFALRMNRPVNQWKPRLSIHTRRWLAKLGGLPLVTSVLFFLIALEIAIAGWFPGNLEPDTILHICWIFLLASWSWMILSYLSAYASDMKQ